MNLRKQKQENSIYGFWNTHKKTVEKLAKFKESLELIVVYQCWFLNFDKCTMIM